MKQSLEIGTVVFSIAGRDSGRFYAVVEIIDDQFVKIADGDMHKIDNAKVKKIKHLKSQEVILPKIAEKLLEEKKIFDAELKSALRCFNGSI